MLTAEQERQPVLKFVQEAVEKAAPNQEVKAGDSNEIEQSDKNAHTKKVEEVGRCEISVYRTHMLTLYLTFDSGDILKFHLSRYVNVNVCLVLSSNVHENVFMSKIYFLDKLPLT